MLAEDAESHRIAAGAADAGRVPRRRELQRRAVPAPTARKMFLHHVHTVPAPDDVHSVARGCPRTESGQGKRGREMRKPSCIYDKTLQVYGINNDNAPDHHGRGSLGLTSTFRLLKLLLVG